MKKCINIGQSSIKWVILLVKLLYNSKSLAIRPLETAYKNLEFLSCRRRQTVGILGGNFLYQIAFSILVRLSGWHSKNNIRYIFIKVSWFYFFSLLNCSMFEGLFYVWYQTASLHWTFLPWFFPCKNETIKNVYTRL